MKLKENIEGYNDEVFIVGSGPSIKNLTLSKLKGKKVIFLNGASLLRYEFQIEPLLIVITDASFVVNRQKIIEKLYSEEKGKLRFAISFDVLREIYRVVGDMIYKHDVYLLKELDPRDPALSVLPNPVYLRDGSLSSNRLTNNIYSSVDDVGVFHCGSVMTAAIQLSAYLQFKNIYLLGFDIGNANQPRFYEKEKDKVRCGLLEDYERGILPFMKMTSDWMRNNNRKVFNCSPVTMLPYSVIPFCDFEKL